MNALGETMVKSAGRMYAGSDGASGSIRKLGPAALVAGTAVALGFASAAKAQDFSKLQQTPMTYPTTASALPTGSPFLDSWFAMATATQNAQPHWMTPIATVTPRLEQEFRSDYFFMNQGNGSHINNWGGGKGLELIPTWDTEVILGFPPYQEVRTAAGKYVSGWGDYPAALLKYRIVSANERDGNYIVTAFLQTSEPTGANTISNNVYVIQPTLAFGMGFGDFDFQGTVSQQYAVATVGPPATLTAFGNPFLGNLALQYHYGQYFWPEFEFNYTYWPFGTHANLSQLLLTPGIIFGRFNLGGRVNAIFGVGYQFAVTDAPVTRNNWAVTTRITF